MRHATHILAVILSLLLPTSAYAQATQDAGPTMRFCENNQDIIGIWQLSNLFESPAGELSKEKEQHPHQYVKFDKSGLYYDAKPKAAFRNIRRANRRLKKNVGSDVWQYLVGEKGVIYFYKNQVFSHSVYCGKVTEGTKGYRKGNIVITPTNAEGKQVYKTYQKVRVRKKRNNQNK